MTPEEEWAVRRAGGELKAKPARRRPRPHGRRPRPHGQWPARRSGLVQKAPHDPLKQFPDLSGRNTHASCHEALSLRHTWQEALSPAWGPPGGRDFGLPRDLPRQSGA